MHTFRSYSKTHARPREYVFDAFRTRGLRLGTHIVFTPRVSPTLPSSPSHRREHLTDNVIPRGFSTVSFRLWGALHVPSVVRAHNASERICMSRQHVRRKIKRRNAYFTLLCNVTYYARLSTRCVCVCVTIERNDDDIMYKRTVARISDNTYHTIRGDGHDDTSFVSWILCITVYSYSSRVEDEEKKNPFFCFLFPLFSLFRALVQNVLLIDLARIIKPSSDRLTEWIDINNTYYPNDLRTLFKFRISLHL